MQVSDVDLRRTAKQVSRGLNQEPIAIAKFEKKVARVARGWLHPAYLWGEIRSAAKSFSP